MRVQERPKRMRSNLFPSLYIAARHFLNISFNTSNEPRAFESKAAYCSTEV